MVPNVGLTSPFVKLGVNASLLPEYRVKPSLIASCGSSILVGDAIWTGDAHCRHPTHNTTYPVVI